MNNIYNSDSDNDCLMIDTDLEETLSPKDEIIFKSSVMGNGQRSENVYSLNSSVERKTSNNIRIKVEVDNGSNKVRRFIQSEQSPNLNKSEISFYKPSTVTACTWPNNSVKVPKQNHQNIAATVVNSDVPTIAINNDEKSKNKIRKMMQRWKRFRDNFKRTQNGIEKAKNKIEQKKSPTKALKNNINIKNDLRDDLRSKIELKVKCNTAIKDNVNNENDLRSKIDLKLKGVTVDKMNEYVKEKPMIIIDGNNVAFAHGQTNFSVKGIELCLEHFEKQEFQVKAICPQMRLKNNQSTDPTRLEVLVREKRVLLTPCKHLPGSFTTSYDDRFILEIASQFDAAVISNDNYVDLLNENSVWKGLIEKRVIGYVWCNDQLFLPKDLYGRNGPSLDDILYK